MHRLAIAVGLCLVGSCGGLLVASSLAFSSQRIRTRLVPWLVSYAVGALLAYTAVAVVPGIRPFVLAISSASLLYIAMSDLIPDLHRGAIDANAARQVVLIAAGIGTIVVFERLFG